MVGAVGQFLLWGGGGDLRLSVWGKMFFIFGVVAPCFTVFVYF